MSTLKEPHISILPSDRIDRQRWDACVQGDPEALIYSHSVYLDAMAGNWQGLVVNDYEAVLALPVKKLAGINMLYTPPFFQRLDIAGTRDERTIAAIGRQVRRSFKLIDLHNTHPQLLQGDLLSQKTNYQLQLDRPYAEIENQYTKECSKNIGKARNRGCVYRHGISAEEVVSFYRQAYGEKAAYKQKHFDRLIAFMESGDAQPYVHLAGVVDEQSGSLIFAAALLDDGKRIYYLLGAPDAAGRKARATAFFIDAVIRKFAGSRQVFDFEGSDIPDVATFYRSFSPEARLYYRFYVNRLPQPLKGLLDKVLR